MSDDYFNFKKFKVRNTNSALKVNTDGVLLGAWASLNKNDNVLEIGTGSGVIALMLNQRFPSVNITAIDVDKLSYNEASFNVKLNEASNINVVLEAVQNYSSIGKTFDHIVSNPPYFQNATKPIDAGLNVAKHNDDLSFLDFWDAVEKLTHNRSSVSVILPFDESKYFIELAKTRNFGIHKILNIRPKVDSKTKRVIIEFRKPEFCVLEISDMFMHHNGQHNYSDEYIHLTKDFYLAF